MPDPVMSIATTTETTRDRVIPFDNSYARLPERFYARQAPTPVAAPRLIRLNENLAHTLGFDPKALTSPASIEALAGNGILPGSTPIATAYAGHQFGNFVPQLGDGRAILLGEVLDRDGQRRDIQLKGAGRTPYSRGGDGRAGLGPVLREYIVSEAMAKLGVPTTRALAALTTGDTVWRETPAPGAILVRVAASHIRVGTFQFFAVRDDVDGLRELTGYTIARHYPAAAAAPNPALAFLDSVVACQAALVAHWMLIGFIHGVMNTDNSSIAGETIDYGPCAFMDAYHPATVFSSIDRHGRYAYQNQPQITQWNLTRLAETLLPLIADDPETAIAAAQKTLDMFPDRYAAAYTTGMRKKLGLFEDRAGDTALARDLLDCMAAHKADFSLTFRHLCDAAADPEKIANVRSLFSDPAGFDAWAARWRARLAGESTDPHRRRAVMRAANPAFIPRNHRVEEVIAAAVTAGDFEPFETLIKVLAAPYDDQPAYARYREPPEPDQIVHQTFCGT